MTFLDFAALGSGLPASASDMAWLSEASSSTAAFVFRAGFRF